MRSYVYRYNPISLKVLLRNTLLLALLFLIIQAIIIVGFKVEDYLVLSLIASFFLLLTELLIIWYPFLKNDKQELFLVISDEQIYIQIRSLNLLKKQHLQQLNIDVTQLLHLEIMKRRYFKQETPYKITNDYHILQLSQNDRKILFVIPALSSRGVYKSLAGLYDYFEFLPVQYPDPKINKFHLILRTENLDNKK